MKAPTGGAIVNRTFFKGGRFMARAFQSVRAVADALRQLSRRPQNTSETITPETANTKYDPEKIDVTFHQPERLTLGKLKNIENTYNLSTKDRLSTYAEQPKDATGPEHPYEANVEHIARFVDAVSKKKLSDAGLLRVMQDDKHAPEEKIVHLVTHLQRDHQTAQKVGWYGEHMNTLDKYLHDYYGWGKLRPDGKELEGKHDPATHHPELVLFKALIAATSASQTPVDNLGSTLRMWNAGQEAGDPILNAPHFNTGALNKFLATLPEEAKTKESIGNTPAEHAKWYAKYVHGTPYTGQGSTPYASRTARIVIAEDEKDPKHGLLLDYSQGDKVVKNKEARNFKPRDGLKVVKVDLPLVKDGSIRAKGWSRYGTMTAASLTKLQALVRSFSAEGKSQKDVYADAARWLLTEHTPEEFDARLKAANINNTVNSKKVYAKGFLDKETNEPIPGSYIFGPKFGSFLLNLHANAPETRFTMGKYLTADKWWTRLFHRYLGKLWDQGIKEQPSARIRPIMRKVVQRVTEKTGHQVSPAELQADLWYYEQNLYRMLGAKSAESWSYADAANQFLNPDSSYYISKPRTEK